MYKKIIILFTVTLIIVGSAAAQRYILNKTIAAGQTISTCSGIFYDTGDSTNGYGLRENYTITFSPSAPNRILQFNFNFIKILQGDTLFAYDGKSTSDFCIGYFSFSFEANGNSMPLNNFLAVSTIHASDTNSTGSITFKFVSDDIAGVPQGRNQGWQGIIECVPACKQRVQASIGTQPIVTACLSPTATINFNAATSYPDNNLMYRQADTSSYFHWYFGDGTDTIKKGLSQVAHTYANQGGYKVYLTITDSNQCINQQPIKTMLQTGITPNFSLAVSNPLCMGDTAILYPLTNAIGMQGGTVLQQQGGFGQQLPIAKPGSLAKINGTGRTFYSRILVDQFAPGQTLTNINDLLAIVLDMEFYRLGNLAIYLTAPNGTRVTLAGDFPSITAGPAVFTYLGEPVANYHLGITGKGYTYTFNNNPHQGTMLATSGLFVHNYVDNTGTTVTNLPYLPADSYATTSPLAALLGTPLNGIWTLSVNDNYALGSGHIFYWKLDFNPAIFPNAPTYTVPITSQQWVQPATGLVATNGTAATVVPPAAGYFPYTYRVTDAYGCVFDTIVGITARPVPDKPFLGNDIALCSSQPTATLTVGNIASNTSYTWSNGTLGPLNNIGAPGMYTVTAENQFACKAKDTVQVVLLSPASLGMVTDTFYCAATPTLLQPIVPSNLPVSYLWNTGATSNTLQANAIGTYWVKATAANGCTATAFTNIADNPVNNIPALADTVICEGASYVKTLNLPASTSILWNDGSSSATKLITAPATYTATVNNAGCLKTLGFSTTTKPVPVISLGSDVAVCQNTVFTKSVSYPNASYTWNTGSTDSIIAIKQQGIYWVEALYNQCSFRDSIDVKYISCDCQTIVPNAFSPNGDGINDGFKPIMQCNSNNVINYSLAIFNRNGQQVFETRNVLEEWKGTYNGKAVPVGTYYYIINYFNNGLQQPERFAGSITILR